MADKTNSSANYAYDVVGNRAAMVYGDGVTNLYQYDAMNRLTNQVCGNANNAAFATFSYGLGPTGNRLWLLESVNGTGRYYAWNYDNLYRLTNEVIRGTTVGNLSYAYDPIGNRTNRTSTISGLNNQSPVYNADDWMTNSDGYDSDGNTTNSAGNFYRYDVMDHLTNATVSGSQVIITYDGDGDRMSKKVGSTTTYYLLDDENPSGYSQVLEEWPSTGTPALSKVYNYGLDLISQRQPGISTNYFIFDGHGSTRVLADIGGTVVNVFAYDAYGNLIASNGVLQTAYLYCAQLWDSDLELYLNRSRYLNPNTGRFWTMDTYEGDNEDPLSLHKYLYVEDNPANESDPSGHYVYSLATILAPILFTPGIASAPGVSSIGGTCGPDVSQAVESTILEIENLFGPPRSGNPVAVDAAYGFANLPEMYERGWDVGPLNELAWGGRPDFGNGSTLGTGTGARTVQFAGHVYYAGSVNYFLWGLMMSKLYDNMRNPLSGAHDVEFSESAAIAATRVHKAIIGDFFDDYEKEAVAFVKFGYTQTYDPSSTALPIASSPGDVGSSARMPWKWIGLHDYVQ